VILIVWLCFFMVLFAFEQGSLVNSCVNRFAESPGR
jgi:hypothetical protein